MQAAPLIPPPQTPSPKPVSRAGRGGAQPQRRAGATLHFGFTGPRSLLQAWELPPGACPPQAYPARLHPDLSAG